MGPVQNQHKKGQCEWQPWGGTLGLSHPLPWLIPNPSPSNEMFTGSWAELVLGEGSWHDLWLQKPLSSFSSSSSFGA